MAGNQSLRQFIRTTTGWLKDAGDFGAALLLVLLIVDLLFPNSSGIVANIGQLMAGISPEGRYGLVALLLFLLIYNRRRQTPGNGDNFISTL